MNGLIGAGLALAIACAAPTAKELTLAISSPKTGATVSINETVQGAVSDPSAHVWLIIHPIATNDCWVQPEAEIEGGKWFVNATFGLPQSMGAQFEIRAIANPINPIQVGQRLPCWPQAQSESAAVRGLVRN
jgi:hypothetical protein